MVRASRPARRSTVTSSSPEGGRTTLTEDDPKARRRPQKRPWPKLRPHSVDAARFRRLKLRAPKAPMLETNAALKTPATAPKAAAEEREG